MKKATSLIALLVLLVGCGAKETTTICKASKPRLGSLSEFKAEGDKVTKLQEEGELNYEDLAITAEDLKEVGEELESLYSNVEGVTYKYSITDKKIEYTLIIEYEKANLEELANRGFIEFSEDEQVKYVSLEETIALLEKDGISCKEK